MRLQQSPVEGDLWTTLLPHVRTDITSHGLRWSDRAVVVCLSNPEGEGERRDVEGGRDRRWKEREREEGGRGRREGRGSGENERGRREEGEGAGEERRGERGRMQGFLLKRQIEMK